MAEQTLTPERLRAAVRAYVELVMAIKEAIQNATRHSYLRGLPSGELYANLMGVITIDQYTTIIETMKENGLVAERNHLLTWVGPMPETAKGA